MDSTSVVFLLLLMAIQGNVVQGQGQCQPQSEPYVVVPSPIDCRKYLIQCLVGGPMEGECPEGNVFSDVDQKCVKRLSDLDNCTSANAVRECEIGKVDLIPHPTSCEGYFNCSDTTPRSEYSLYLRFETECYYPNLFDINQRKCVPYEHAVCGNGRVAKDKLMCDYNSPDILILHCLPCQLCSVDNPSCFGKEDGFWPHPEKLWSSSYIRCHSERFVDGEKCSEDDFIGMTQIFHPQERKCQPLWNIPKEHGGYEPSCDSKLPGYYEIDGAERIAYRCPGKEKFECEPRWSSHNNIRLCTALQQIGPADDFCIGKEDGLWPNAAKLWSQHYVECFSQAVKNGEGRCPIVMNLTQVFHPQKLSCVPLWDIPQKHGGFYSSCESKEPGIYTYDILAYRCPGEMKFLCRPPLYHESNDDDVRRCDPIVEDSEGNTVENCFSVVGFRKYWLMTSLIVGRWIFPY